MQKLSTLRNDLPASIVVFFVAVPLCLGIALASGAPLFSGLIAGMIGGAVVGLISGSPLGVSGPAAGLAVIVLNAIGELGFQTFLLAVVISGGIQILLGIFRAGVLGYFFPSSVISGMLAGIGIIIVLKQIPHALGRDSDPEGELQFTQPDGETTFSGLTRALEGIDWNVVLVAAVALFILIFWEQVLSKLGGIFKLIQGPLVAVAFGIVYQVLTSRFFPGMALSPDHLVSVPVPKSFEDFGALFESPNYSAISDPAVWIAGATIGIVGSLETLLCVEATDKLDPQKRVTPTNRELVAQGTGNMLSGAVGGLPITQVIVRSSANIQSGANSKISAIVHGLLIFISVVAIPQILNLVPLAVLASILFVVGYKLAKPATFKKMYNLGWTQFLPFIVTIAGIVFTDLLTGIFSGVVVAIAMILRRSFENSHFLHKSESDASGKHEVRLRLAEEVIFLNKGAILRELSKVQDGSKVTIDMGDCVYVDHDVYEVIEDFRTSAPSRGIDVTIVPQGERAAKRALETAETPV